MMACVAEIRECDRIMAEMKRAYAKELGVTEVSYYDWPQDSKWHELRDKKDNTKRKVEYLTRRMLPFRREDLLELLACAMSICSSASLRWGTTPPGKTAVRNNVFATIGATTRSAS